MLYAEKNNFLVFEYYDGVRIIFILVLLLFIIIHNQFSADLYYFN